MVAAVLNPCLHYKALLAPVLFLLSGNSESFSLKMKSGNWPETVKKKIDQLILHWISYVNVVLTNERSVVVKLLLEVFLYKSG